MLPMKTDQIILEVDKKLAKQMHLQVKKNKETSNINVSIVCLAFTQLGTKALSTKQLKFAVNSLKSGTIKVKWGLNKYIVKVDPGVALLMSKL